LRISLLIYLCVFFLENQDCWQEIPKGTPSINQVHGNRHGEYGHNDLHLDQRTQFGLLQSKQRQLLPNHALLLVAGITSRSSENHQSATNMRVWCKQLFVLMGLRIPNKSALDACATYPQVDVLDLSFSTKFLIFVIFFT